MGGFFHTAFNTGAGTNNVLVPPRDMGGGLAVGWNRSLYAETNFYNVFPYNGYQKAFQFSQNTGGSSYSDLMTIQGNGNIGIGTTSPRYKLDVYGGLFHTTYNTQLPPQPDTSGGVAIGWNRSNGGGETNFYNVFPYPSAQTAFQFSQITQSPAPNYVPGNVDLMTILGNGNIGIGTTAPRYKLDVNGGFFHTTFNTGPGTNNPLVPPQDLNGGLAVGWNRSGGGGETNFYNVFPNDPIAFQFSVNKGGSSYLDLMTIFSNGAVGIGTPVPSNLQAPQCASGATQPCKLIVNGAISAAEVVVSSTPWSDYVFKPGYRLRPLKEVAAYIQQNQHLPEIPSEKEVQEKGVSVGAMQAKLLAKIEELTLHMIQADEENRQLKDRIGRLEARDPAKPE